MDRSRNYSDRRSPPPNTRDYEGRNGGYNNRGYEGGYDPGRDHRDGPRYRSRSPRNPRYQDDDMRGHRERDRRYDRRDYYDYTNDRADPRNQDGYLEYEETLPPANTGDDDVSLEDDGENNKKWILVRNLKDSVSEELFAKGLEKLNKSEESDSGASETSLRRVILIRDRETDKSAGFGFAEYGTVKDANAALAKATQLGDKCTVSSKVMVVNFPHSGVFPPVISNMNEKYTFLMRANGQSHKYRDERYYPTVLIINPEPIQESSASQDPDSSTPSSKGTDKPTKKRKAPTVAAPAIMQLWQNKAAELRDQQERDEQRRTDERAAVKNRPPATGVNAAPVIPSDYYEQTFAVDSSALRCCFLCGAKFNASEGLQKHLKESEKHAGNLKSAKAIADGFTRLKSKNIAPEDTIRLLGEQRLLATLDNTGPPQPESQYVDCAAERRKNQARAGDAKDKVGFSLSSAKKNKSTPPDASPSDTEPAKPSYNKGLGMLQKSGWTEGQGLGAEGTGSTGPLEQTLYAKRVGLGHQSSKTGDATEEAKKMTTGEGPSFVEKTRENARQRFENIG